MTVTVAVRDPPLGSLTIWVCPPYKTLAVTCAPAVIVLAVTKKTRVDAELDATADTPSQSTIRVGGVGHVVGGAVVVVGSSSGGGAGRVVVGGAVTTTGAGGCVVAGAVVSGGAVVVDDVDVEAWFVVNIVDAMVVVASGVRVGDGWADSAAEQPASSKPKAIAQRRFLIGPRIRLPALTTNWSSGPFEIDFPSIAGDGECAVPHSFENVPAGRFSVWG